MAIYNDVTGEVVVDPDLSAGYVYNGYITTGRTEDTYEVIEGSITDSRPEGLQHLVPGQDITEPCQWYHKNTAAPEPDSDTVTWAELAAAYNEGVLNSGK